MQKMMQAKKQEILKNEKDDKKGSESEAFKFGKNETKSNYQKVHDELSSL